MATPSWREYQEEAAAHFRSVGLDAKTDVELRGARAKHAVDVAVWLSQAGHESLWVVECKDWLRPIPKERVLVLAEVVKDVGADRGVLLSESGFQSGAARAARNTNIELTSLKDLRARVQVEKARAGATALLDALSLCAVSARSRLLPAPSHPNLPSTFGGVLPSLEARVAQTSAGLRAALKDEFPSCVDIDEHELPVMVNSLTDAVQGGVSVLRWAQAQSDHLADLIQAAYPDDRY